MTHELPRLEAREREASTIDDVIEAPLEELPEDITRLPDRLRSLRVQNLELTLRESVHITCLLLLLELSRVLRGPPRA
jgi:hypothetical protein